LYKKRSFCLAKDHLKPSPARAAKANNDEKVAAKAIFDIAALVVAMVRLCKF
jgi:hypothetical protein